MNNDIAKDAAELAAIGERLRTQDNRCTASPMFCVQEKVRDFGYSPEYTDEYVWVDRDGYEAKPGTFGVRKVGYKERWQTVMMAFTEEGCAEHLRINGHNYRGETRIYAESFYRCPEMLAIREALMSGNFIATAADKERIAELQRTLSEKATECIREAADVNQLRAQLAAKTQECEGLREDKARLDWLNQEAGFFQDDSATKISISPDDATCTWHVEIGKTKGYARSIRGAIDSARKEGE